MNKTASEAAVLIQSLLPQIQDATIEVVVCPPFTALERAWASLKGSSVALGAQGVFWKDEGAYTGEIAPAMLKEFDVRYVIVGHSERRQHFHESDDDVNRRALATLSHGMRPIVCVGELLAEREEGRTHEVVTRQLKAALVDFTPELALKSVIAYEPVWAIGTGKVATPDEAQDVHRMIREVLAELLGEDAAAKIRLQYGGSVSPDNAAGLFAQPDIDGALVGGASLQAEKFAAIVKAACRTA